MSAIFKGKMQCAYFVRMKSSKTSDKRFVLRFLRSGNPLTKTAAVCNINKNNDKTKLRGSISTYNFRNKKEDLTRNYKSVTAQFL